MECDNVFEETTDTENPPYDQGILATIEWGLESNTPLQKLPLEENWCQSQYKCYYGGVIPGHFKAKEAATNFVMSSMDNVDVSDNPNKPIRTKLVTDSFFIILMDVRDKNNIKTHFFFYDGPDTVKNFHKIQISLKEFTLENVGQFRKPWQKINKKEIEAASEKLKEMFKNFLDKVELQQTNNEKHENNCECCKDHDASEFTGHN